MQTGAEPKGLQNDIAEKIYEAGYTPICPLLSLPEVIDTSNADEYKDYMDMSEDMLRRSRILVVCGSAVDDTVLTDIAIANRFHVASSTMRGVLGVDKNKKRTVTLWIQPSGCFFDGKE